MLIILPLLVFIALFMVLMGYHSKKDRTHADWRSAFIQTSLIWGVFLVVYAEIFSTFNGINAASTAIAWSFFLICLFILGRVKRLFSWGVLPKIQFSFFDWTMLTIIIVICGLLFFVALLSPPNNIDSLQYHMARVVHWAQNGSLQHYATGFAPQLMNPVWAELSILNFRLLWGSDQLSNLVQWFSLIGCMVIISGIAKLLGANRTGQWFSALIVLSLPMAILQSTSTQNDLVVALWLLCLIYYALLSTKRDLLIDESLALAAACGCGLLTKGTFYPYGLAVGLWLIAAWLIKRKPLKVFLFQGTYIAIAVFILNCSYWIRNIITFGGPLGSPEFVAKLTAPKNSVMAFLSEITRNIVMNFVTPFPVFNEKVLSFLQNVFGKYEPTLYEFKFLWNWNYEDTAGSPFHLTIIFLSILMLVFYWKKLKDKTLFAYAGLSMFLLICLVSVIHNDLFGMRYQLPFLISWAALIGTLVTMINKKWIKSLLLVFLVLITLPYVLINRTRPLIAMRDSPDPFTIPCISNCSLGSILNENKDDLLFGTLLDFKEPYQSAANYLNHSECKEIGLQIDSHEPEYPYWWLLSAPQSGYRLETIYPVAGLEKLIDQDFKPCAVICTVCQNKSSIHGLQQVAEFGFIKIFSGSNYTTED